ncbi:MAG: MBL fold metallo-hydrolase [Bacteroidetes bacterium]|nr:MBL fold metallo-hydrolase [Bacteroidota bacterium]
MIRLILLETGNLMLDGGAMFGTTPKSVWHKLYPEVRNNLTNWAMRSLLLDCEDRKILIDAGIGPFMRSYFSRIYHLNGEDTLEKSMEQAGYSPEDITDVIFTHLHFDHCGGGIRQGTHQDEWIPAFPKATYHISRVQWETANHPSLREKSSFLKESFLPIQTHHQLHLLDPELERDLEPELVPELELRQVHGHSPGQLIPFIHTPEKTYVFAADLLPSAAHLPLQHTMAYDLNPALSVIEKKNLLREAEKMSYALILQHDLYYSCLDFRINEKTGKTEVVRGPLSSVSQ